MEQQELLIRLDAQMQGLVKIVTQMGLQLDKLTSDHDKETTSNIAVAQNDIKANKERIEKLEGNFRAAIILAITEGLAIAGILLEKYL